MTVAFTALLALVVRERVSEATGAILLWPALVVGAFSVLLWRWTGDLRLYFWVQSLPAFAVLLLFSLYSANTPVHIIGSLPWLCMRLLYCLNSPMR